MKISWTDKMRNDVLNWVKEDCLQCRRRIVKQKLSYAGYILRGSSGNNILLILVGRQNLREESKGTAKKNVDG